MKKKSTSSMKSGGGNQTNPYVDLNSAYDKLKRGEFQEKEREKKASTSSRLTEKTSKKKPIKPLRTKEEKKKKKPVCSQLQKVKNKKEDKSASLFRKQERTQESPIIEKKVEKKKPKVNVAQVKMTVVLVSGLLLLFSMATLLVARYSEIAKVQYEINRMNKDLAEKQTQIEELKVKLESHNGSEMIEKYAREHLGMEYPKEEKITYIRVN